MDNVISDLASLANGMIVGAIVVAFVLALCLIFKEVFPRV